MKKILAALFLVLVMSCLYAQEFEIYEASISENDSINDYSFDFIIETTDGSEYVIVILPPTGYKPKITFNNNSFIEECFNISKFGDFVVYPVSFSFSVENSYWFPSLYAMTFDRVTTAYDPVDNPNASIFLDYNSTKMLELISALLNDGFVIFDLEYIDYLSKDDEGNYITYSKRYYWNIPDEESRKKALETFNRYTNFFYE